MIRRGPALLRPFLESSGRTGLCWFKRETQPVREIVPALFSGLICCRSRRNKEISEYLHRSIFQYSSPNHPQAAADGGLSNNATRGQGVGEMTS